jgi:hypothetical protein
MNKSWLLSILGITFTLLCILKAYELRSLSSYFPMERTIKLKSFTEARSKVATEDLGLLKLWESILTGRSAPLPRFMKERYQSLGLNHLFTPSGFHLSAVLLPFMKLLKTKHHIFVLILIGAGLFFLPGLTAMKRMLVIKTHQKVLGIHLGFVIALIMDVFFGSFQTSALSFTYSFLFLGIIYSNLKGLALIIWFFIGQIMLAYFQNSDISPLLLLFSPLLNLGFGFIMPLLFVLSFPLWDWQLHTGIYLLRILQRLVDLFSLASFEFPFVEIHSVTLLLLALILYKKRSLALITLILISSSLNLDREKSPGLGANDFTPRGKIKKTIYTDKIVKVYFEDGRCNLKLVRGYWFENCSPKRRGSKRKKIMKLSYPSREQQKSSLRG